MQDYKEAVELLAKYKEDFTFPNKGAEHAKIVTREIFKNSDIVRIFSGRLDYEILKDIEEEINNFIKNKKILIILDKEPTQDNKLIKELCDKNIQIKLANDDFRKEIKNLSKNKKLMHFIVGDDNKFRIETNIDEYKAICNFNNSEISKKFIDVFDRFFDDLQGYKCN